MRAERLAQEADDPLVDRDDRHAEAARAERRAGEALGVARIARDRGGRAERLARGGLVAAAQERLAADEEHVGAQRAAAGVERLERRRRGGGRVLVRELRHAVARGAERDLDRGRRVAARRGREPVGRELAEAARVVPVERLERVGDRAVQPHPPGEAELLVDRLADERVGEAVAAGPRAVLADELRRGRLLDGLEDVDARERVEALEQGEVEVAPDDGGGLQRAVRAVAQARQATAEDLAHALRDPRARARLARWRTTSSRKNGLPAVSSWSVGASSSEPSQPRTSSATSPASSPASETRSYSRSRRRSPSVAASGWVRESSLSR